ncbi:hypothetical protein HDU97_006196 [Phlyctochytrium planicorne]|nr:hypothetical protein HDU97_006196 [Phlyctochytrium planicorne]
MIHAHRSVVAARCPFLAKQLATKWANVDAIPVKHYKVHPVTLKAVLLWMYTGQVASDLSEDQLNDLEFICRQWRLTFLQSQVQILLAAYQAPPPDPSMYILNSEDQDRRPRGGGMARNATSKRSKKGKPKPSEENVEEEGGEKENIGEEEFEEEPAGKPRIVQRPLMLRPKTAVVKMDSRGVQVDMKVLVDVLVGELGHAWALHKIEPATTVFPPPTTFFNEDSTTLLQASHPDIIIRITDPEGSQTLFPCHRTFLTRSEYFKGLLMGNFAEASILEGGESTLPILDITVVDDPDVFRCVLEFLYTHDTAGIRKSTALKIMECSDFLLLPRLKTLTVNYLVSFYKDLHDDMYFSDPVPEIVCLPDGGFVVEGAFDDTGATNKPLNADFSLQSDEDDEETNVTQFDDTNPIIPTPSLLLRASWAMNLPRLEQHLTRFYAERLSRPLCSSKVFRALIKDSSDSVVNKQELDTVIFVDDLRWWIGKIHGFDAGPNDDVGVPGKFIVGEDADNRRRNYVWKMALVDRVLEELGIEI